MFCKKLDFTGLDTPFFAKKNIPGLTQTAGDNAPL